MADKAFHIVGSATQVGLTQALGLTSPLSAFMKDKRFWLGILTTLLWLGYAWHMLVTHPHPNQLNEWGDFFAGFFAPLAFLWLVIGYLQQGEELKQSTRALRLQAEELRNSVEQQSQLVAVSREQMKHELEVIQEERERRRDSARPIVYSSAQRIYKQFRTNNAQVKARQYW